MIASIQRSGSSQPSSAWTWASVPLRPIYEEAGKALGREFKYPGDD